MVGRPQATHQCDGDEAPVAGSAVTAGADRREPAQGEQRRPGDEAGLERVDALDSGLRPEAGRGGEERRRGRRRSAADRHRPAGQVEQAHGEAGAEGREQAHPEGDRSEGQQEGPELAEKDVERIPGRMRNAQRRHRRHQLAGIPDVDRPARPGGVDREEGEREPGAHRAIARRAAQPTRNHRFHRGSV